VLELAIGLGITVNLVFSEVFGVAAPGLVVPGYLALYLTQADRVAATIGLALVTWAVVRFGFARLVVLYGRRRFGLTVLTGFVLNLLFARALRLLPAEPLDLRVIGFIVPGLMANHALAQGVWSTLILTLLAAVVVRLLLMLLVGWTGW
jgi:poly-gamma-glutamate biosynthesis protein PgsC/CapC